MFGSPSPITLMVAVLLDALFKDPRYRLHPVRLIGDAVYLGETLCRRLPFSQLTQGVVLVLVVEVLTVASVLLLEGVFSLVNLRWVATLFLGYSALAGGALWGEVEGIGELLVRGDLPGARHKLSFLVTRETSRMNESEIVKTAVESLAENTCDGIVAPMLFFALGGAPLAFFYKASDTLDSMVGYRTPRYLQFGRAAARLDDLLNFLPARLTALLVSVSAWSMGLGFKRTWGTVKEFADKTSSPNSGYPEAAFAGALEVRLGGEECVYFGETTCLPAIGDGRDRLQPRDLYLAVNLSKATTLFALLLSLLLVVISPCFSG